MYLKHFGLKEFPFRLTPDSDFLYMSTAHARAKAYMDYTVWNREGFVVITGEVGTGKTTLLQKMLSELDKNVLVAKVFQTQLDDVEFLQAVLVEFGLEPFAAKKVQLIDMLNSFLLEQFRQLKQLVLIVDDAHNLSNRALEEIRMLSGLETRKQKILHVILVGQPELNARLEAPGMEQLLQRVRLRYHLKALSEDEIEDYIDHRMSVAGAKNKIFPHESIAEILRYTGGIPRLINTLCDTVLTCAYADNQSTIGPDTVAAAIDELQWPPYTKRIGRERDPKTEPNETESNTDRMRLSVIEKKIQSLEALIPPVASMARHVSEISATLKQIAAALDPPEEKGTPSDTPRKQRIGEK